MSDREPYKWITVKGKHIPVYKDEHGQDVFGNGISSAQRIEKQLIDKDSYLYSDEYKQVNQGVIDAQTKLDNYENRIKELKKIIEEESKPDETKGKFADMFIKLSDKGKKAKEELDEIEEFWLESAELDVQMAESDVKEFKNKQSEIQSEKFYHSPSTVSGDVKESYVGFEKDIHISKYQDLLESGKAQIVEMSPKEYLQRTAYDIFAKRPDVYRNGLPTYEDEVRTAMADAEHTMNLVNLMQNGTKMYMPMLNYDELEQEGRHRAVAATMLGIEKMPVLIVPKKGRTLKF